jgi:hypothetical protein
MRNFTSLLLDIDIDIDIDIDVDGLNMVNDFGTEQRVSLATSLWACLVSSPGPVPPCLVRTTRRADVLILSDLF